MTKTGLRTASPWIDLHMHSIVSDGTDRPEELLQKAKDAGLKIFSVTDHDSVNACSIVQTHLKPGDPCFINGAEFSCRDEEGKYHILAYGFDHESDAIEKVVRAGHTLRMNKVQRRIDFLKSDFGMEFPEADLAELFSLDNPGKPHIALMMVKNGFAESKEDAIRNYIDKLHLKGVYLGPEEVIRGILDAGGIPVLAHPAYGSGDELILGEEMDMRLRHLIPYGLAGIEAFYSGFTGTLTNSMLSFARKFGLMVTAGSDYHGQNKMIVFGDTGLDQSDEIPEELQRFLAHFQQ